MRYQAQLERLREKKIAHTRAKLEARGHADTDDYGWVLAPEGFDWGLPADGWHGAAAWGRVFRGVMERHPVYLDADDALAGRWMLVLTQQRPYPASPNRAPFPFDYPHLVGEQELYDIISGIGADNHFGPDYKIGLELGWGGLKAKAEASLARHAGDGEAEELLLAELDAVAGVQDWIARTAAEAARRADAAREGSWERENLRALAEINGKLVAAPPATFREACQWIAWFNMASRTYNIDGAGGQLDELLRPYYERDKAAGALDDDEAVWILACLLLNDTHYYQVGGPDADGRDQASRVSHLILDAADAMAVSCNVTVRVVEGFDESLFRRGVDLLFKHQLGFPRFSGDESLVAGLMRSGFDAATARQRIAVGCHWMSLPGREYTLNDVVKVNLAKVFEVAWQEFAAGGPTRMGTDPVSVGGRGAGGAAAGGTAPAASAQTEPDPLSIGERGAGGAAPGGTAPAASAQTGPGPLSVGERGADGAGAAGTASGISADTAAGALLAGGTEALFGLFAAHLRRAVACVVSGIEFHLDHQWRNEPELMLNLLSHGPIERGRDASHGGAEFYNMCVDGAGLATVADSFAALEQRVEADGVLTWSDVAAALDANFHGPVGERARGLLAASPRFGGGLTAGDRWARRITDLWVDLVAGAPARDGVVFIPGWFSWANTLHFGSTVGATPNGRRAGEPISHGANPHPGFRRDGALTALVKAVADVQPGRGNTAPLQLEVDPCAARSPNAKQVVGDLLKAHFALGGTLANVNIVDAAKILDAHAHPDKYPDLVVRVTGFTAYFANLSPEFRQLVVDRIIQEPVG